MRRQPRRDFQVGDRVEFRQHAWDINGPVLTGVIERRYESVSNDRPCYWYVRIPEPRAFAGGNGGFEILDLVLLDDNLMQWVR